MTAIDGDGTGLTRARVMRGDGGEGALARVCVEQVGRAAEGEPQVILFADRSAAAEVFGGAAQLDGDEREVTIEATAGAEIWMDPADLEQAGACPSDEAFDAARASARKASGFSRVVSTALFASREVFLFGHFRPRGAGLALEPARDGGMLVATFDPRPWLDGKIRLVALFIVAELALAALCTRVALTPPRFGTVSSIGGALCLAFFLLLQPAGKMVRDAVRTPDRRLLEGRWARRAQVAGVPSRAPELEPSVGEEAKRGGMAA